MPLYEVIVDFTQTRSIRKLIEADDPQEADDRATPDLNGAGALDGWEPWGETAATPEIVSTERVAGQLGINHAATPGGRLSVMAVASERVPTLRL